MPKRKRPQHNGYLLGDANDAANWGDPTKTKGGNWAPLERVVAPPYRSNFMFMEQIDAVVEDRHVVMYLYKHDMTREYVNVDADGRLYEWMGNYQYSELTVEEARDRLVGRLVDAIERGVDISRNMTEAYERLAQLTGLALRGHKPD